MASRNWDFEQVLGKKRYKLDLTIFPNAAGVPDLRGEGQPGPCLGCLDLDGPAHVPLQDTYRRLISKPAHLQMNAATDLTLQFGAFSNVGTSTPVSFTVRALAAATPDRHRRQRQQQHQRFSCASRTTRTPDGTEAAHRFGIGHQEGQL